MNNITLVSAIIIFFNGEKYLEEAIESVIAQTYNRWELLLVDDGSTEQSTAIAQQYAQKYPQKICYLEHENHQNRGMSATRNLGISQAKGEYIAFLDADDIWLPQKLEKQVALLDSKPEIDIVCNPTQLWYSWTGNPQHVSLDLMREVSPEYNRVFEPPILLTLLLQDKAKTPATCSVLIRRSLFKKIGLFEEIFRGMYEDQVFFAKIYLHTSVFVTHEYYDRYRQHPDNCTSVAEQQGQYIPAQLNPAHLKFLQWLSQYLREQNIEDVAVLQALKQALWVYDHPILYYILHPELLARLIARKLLTVEIRDKLWIKYQQVKTIIAKSS